MLFSRIKIGLLCALAVSLASCGEYSKILRSEDPVAHLDYAKKLFEQQKYPKVVKVLEPYYQHFKNTNEAENADWMMAYSCYMDDMYEPSGYLMGNFAKTYPLSDKNEQAAFMAAQSSYNISPDSYLDQENTTKAINALQRFIEHYPTAPQVAQADSMVRELNEKLDKKAFDIAYNYYRLEEYNSAMIAFTNALDDRPYTTERENLMYYRAKAAAIYANKSIPDKQAERYADAITYGRLFLRQFPESDHYSEIEQAVKAMENKSAILDQVIKDLGDKDGLDEKKMKKYDRQVQKEEKAALRAQAKEQKKQNKE